MASLRIATWNLLHGQRIPPADSGINNFSANLHEIADRIASAKIDVIGLEEIDAHQDRSDTTEQIEIIAQRLGAKDLAYARTVIGTPGVKWRKVKRDEAVLNPADSLPSYGIGLISQVPVKQWQVLPLGRSLIGLPLAVPGVRKNGKPGVQFIYVKDEPRLALAATLESGVTVVVTHLSFVPLVNLYQLWRVKRWIGNMPGRHILLGDLNLIGGLPVRSFFLKPRGWISLVKQNSYPSWKPKVQFDYILADKKDLDISQLEVNGTGYSDHAPLAVEINFAS